MIGYPLDTLLQCRLCWDQQYLVLLQVEYCQFPGISIIVDVTPPCTPFASLAPALPFKEFAIYWFYTRSILMRSYNFARVA